MIQQLYDQWQIQPHHICGDVFTGYEPIEQELSKFTKSVYDQDPEGTIEKIFALYRSKIGRAHV